MRSRRTPAPGRTATYVALTVLGAAIVSAATLWSAGNLHFLRAGHAPPQYVGAASCVSCHSDIAARWRPSHHALAMRVASDSTVAGDFANGQFTHAGTTTTFSRRNGRFIITTQGPDAKLHQYDVQYTFGIAPLQQYLIALDRGRLQAFDIAWDTRPRSAGGQRWFKLRPNESARPGEEWHWTGIAQNWNYSCAECHSTNVKKNYDPAADRFATTFAEPNVSCEACHGPGSRHVASKGRTPFPAFSRSAEVERCARCHSRREQFSDQYDPSSPLGNTHRVVLLDDPLYHVDGQIRDEVFEYGSFVQSRMYAKGVVCSDCHEPHSATLRASGNQLCTRCHAAATYDSPNHSFHTTASPGASCVGCHMPTRSYMVIHDRHDHSLRVPRPDLSVAFGVPNACTSCHRNRDASWAVRELERRHRYPPRGYQNYAGAFAADARDDSSATRRLIAVANDLDQPAIARATAIERLGPRLDPSFDGAFNVLRRSLADSSPLVRVAAISAFAQSDTAVRVRMLAPLLADTIRVVRMDAARALAGVAPVTLDESVARERFNADRPENHLNLALLLSVEQRFADAERELHSALAIDPRFSPALVNLADLFRATGRDANARELLDSALRVDSTNAAAHHALGLFFVRQKHLDQALPELERAARLAPERAHYGNVYALALGETGKRKEAGRVLEQVLSRHAFDRDALSLVVANRLAIGDTVHALKYAQRLAAIDPNNAEVRTLLGQLTAGHR